MRSIIEMDGEALTGLALLYALYSVVDEIAHRPLKPELRAQIRRVSQALAAASPTPAVAEARNISVYRMREEPLPVLLAAAEKLASTLISTDLASVLGSANSDQVRMAAVLAQRRLKAAHGMVEALTPDRLPAALALKIDQVISTVVNEVKKRLLAFAPPESRGEPSPNSLRAAGNFKHRVATIERRFGLRFGDPDFVEKFKSVFGYDPGRDEHLLRESATMQEPLIDPELAIDLAMNIAREFITHRNDLPSDALPHVQSVWRLMVTFRQKMLAQLGSEDQGAFTPLPAVQSYLTTLTPNQRLMVMLSAIESVARAQNGDSLTQSRLRALTEPESRPLMRELMVLRKRLAAGVIRGVEEDATNFNLPQTFKVFARTRAPGAGNNRAQKVMMLLRRFVRTILQMPESVSEAAKFDPSSYSVKFVNGRTVFFRGGKPLKSASSKVRAIPHIQAMLHRFKQDGGYKGKTQSRHAALRSTSEFELDPKEHPNSDPAARAQERRRIKKLTARGKAKEKLDDIRHSRSGSKSHAADDSYHTPPTRKAGDSRDHGAVRERQDQNTINAIDTALASASAAQPALAVAARGAAQGLRIALNALDVRDYVRFDSQMSGQNGVLDQVSLLRSGLKPVVGKIRPEDVSVVDMSDPVVEMRSVLSLLDSVADALDKGQQLQAAKLLFYQRTGERLLAGYKRMQVRLGVGTSDITPLVNQINAVLAGVAPDGPEATDDVPSMEVEPPANNESVINSDYVKLPK